MKLPQHFLHMPRKLSSSPYRPLHPSLGHYMTENKELNKAIPWPHASAIEELTTKKIVSKQRQWRSMATSSFETMVQGAMKMADNSTAVANSIVSIQLNLIRLKQNLCSKLHCPITSLIILFLKTFALLSYIRSLLILCGKTWSAKTPYWC